MNRRRATFSETALAALFFAAATVVLTWPIAPHAADGLSDLWDAKLTAWAMHWDFHQVFRDPLHLYDANIFYPARYALAFSENLFGAALFGFPLYAAGFSTLLVYNVLFLLGMFLSGLAAWALAREITGDSLASVVAGVVFACCPWRIAQIPHIQFQWGAFLALSMLFLMRYLEDGRRRDAVLFGVSFTWNALCNVHYALFSGFLVALVLAYEGVAYGWTRFRPRFGGALVALGISAIVIVPFLAPYALASNLYGMSRSEEEIAFYSGTWSDFLTAGAQNKLYAPWTQKWGKAEGDFFPGISVVGLAALALLRRRRAERKPQLQQANPLRRRIARILDVPLVVSLALWLLALFGRTALGPLKFREPGRVAVVLVVFLLARLTAAFPRWSRFSDLGDCLRRIRFGSRAGLFLSLCVLGVLVALGTHTPFYRFLVESFGPLFRAIRAPSRGIVLFDLGLGVLAAWGLADLLRGRGRAVRLGGAAAAILAIGFEYRAFPVAMNSVDPKPAPVHRWLATVAFPGAVAEFPLGFQYDFESEFRSTANWKPLINGTSGFEPPGYHELAADLAQKPIPDGVWNRLQERKAVLLVFHPGQAGAAAARTYAEAIRAGVRLGRIEPLRSFPHGDHVDVVFRLSSAPPFDLPPDDHPDQTRRALVDPGSPSRPGGTPHPH